MTDSLPDFDFASIDLAQVEFLNPPSSNTGGNPVSPPQKADFPGESSQKCKIDYLSFTSTVSMAHIRTMISVFTPDVEFVDQGRGWMGFPQSQQIQSFGENIGLVAWGAKEHDRNYVSFSGAGCKRWSDYRLELVVEVLRICEARITRVDLALDFYRGEVTYDDCEAALAAGEFQMKAGGRRPAVDRHSTEGAYGNAGRTLYVGSPRSSKRICMYEKGLEQFGKLPAHWLENQTPESVASYRLDGSVGIAGDVSVLDWLRAEVRYSNDDKDLDANDYAIIRERDAFFAGAYPFCARVMGLADGVRPPTLLSEVETDVEKMKLNLKNSYGGLVHSLRSMGYTDAQIVDAVDSGSHCKRLVKNGLFRHLDEIVPF
jgi:DNA relaxase NicK